MAEISAVGWVVSPVIKLIIDKTQSYISNKLFHADLEHDMRQILSIMKITLLEILSTVVIVEEQRIEDPNQVKLVWQIKDAVYDAKDAIDEFDYNILEAKSDQQESTVSPFISFPSTEFEQKVKEVNKKLNLAKGSAEKLLELMNVTNSLNIHLDFTNKNGCGLDVLGDMNNIKGFLTITGLDKVTSREEAIRAQLHKKQSVTTLELQWKCDLHPSETESSKCQQVLEALVPNHNVQSLKLSGFMGAAWPSWLETNLLSSVESIYLSWATTKMLPSLGQLPLLKKLHISNLYFVSRIGVEFYGKGSFPSLEDLSMDYMFFLKEWCYPYDTPVFPKLNKLKISRVKLECFSLPQYVQIRLTKLEVSNWEKLTTLEGLDELVSLQRFYIYNCPNLLSLPEMKLFYQLQFLAIVDCPNLNSLPKKGLPVSLGLLCIGGAKHQSLEDQIRNKKGPEWDKLAAIAGCHLCADDFVNLGDDYLGTYASSIFDFDSSIEDCEHYPRLIEEFQVNKDVGADLSTVPDL